jgi:23S rRNA (uracil1939-C5)-methyltransferase
VVGIEERPAAVKDANQNIALNKLANVKIVAGLAEKEFPRRADVAVLDPPRGGCSEQALKKIVRAEPRRIIYVSCNPATLARDLKALVKESYRIEVIQPVDMFPQTEHVEVVVKLSRGS